MKEKRYFCDYWYGSRGRYDKIVAMSLIIIEFFSIIIGYNVMISKYENRLTTYYYESTYQHLDEIADNVIQEGIGINLSAMKEDMVKYGITNKNNEVIFKYYLDNDDLLQLSMTIKLSENFEVTSKKKSYGSVEEYIRNVKITIIGMYVGLGVMIWIVTMFVVFIGVPYVATVSKINKNKNL